MPTKKMKLKMCNLRNEVSLYKELLAELKKEYFRNKRKYLQQIKILRAETEDYKNQLLSKEKLLENIQNDYTMLQTRHKYMLRRSFNSLKLSKEHTDLYEMNVALTFL